MPLTLSTQSDRPQLITFDPTIAAEAKDAFVRRVKLEKQGYRVREEAPGAIRLDPPPVGPTIHTFRVLSEEGDERLVWDRHDPNQVREAFTKFRDFMKRGYSAYVILSSGKKGHRIDDFDPGLEQVLLSEKQVVLVPPTMPG